ncbi:MAG TPA: azurin, partial [Gammaproteobacteria bacterium]|nr:azurin [Gammaproteobacteria bacterium]
MKRLILVIVVIWAHTALAQTPHEVQQILDINNNVPDMLYRFEPDYLSIATGETVRFLGTVRGQTVHSVRDMLPDGADKIAIMPRDNPDVTFTVPGVYGIRCMKHARHGMVTLIVVGNDYPNLAAVRAAVPKGLNWFAHPKMYRLLDRA